MITGPITKVRVDMPVSGPDRFFVRASDYVICRCLVSVELCVTNAIYTIISFWYSYPKMKAVQKEGFLDLCRIVDHESDSDGVAYRIVEEKRRRMPPLKSSVSAEPRKVASQNF